MAGAADARTIEKYYGHYDDLLDTGEVFTAFRNSGAVANHYFGVSVFDERPVEEIIAIARDNEAFAAYLRTTREWAIAHTGLLENLRIESETLLHAIRVELGEEGFEDASRTAAGSPGATGAGPPAVSATAIGSSCGGRD